MAASLRNCPKKDCTVATTGICLLSHKNLDDCPELKKAAATPVVVSEAAEPEPAAAPEVATARQRTFHSGLELGTEDAAVLMREDYTHLIGILGSWNAGKTCFLSSLYLMVANGFLRPRYTFKSSRTLQGFEDRARLTREWPKEKLPETLADHTTLADPRQPSLLHMSLKVEGAAEALNLLFTDLPGEWSKNLADRKSMAPAFEFFNRAEVVFIVIDCELMESETRFAEIPRLKMLIERLAKDVNLDRSIPIVLVLSKADMVDFREPSLIKDLVTHGESFGFKMDKILVAAFSSKPGKIENGEGIVDCLDKIRKYSLTSPPSMNVVDSERGPRMFEQFRA